MKTSVCIMQLLFDQNSSFRLVKKISDLYPLAAHVKQLGLQNATDIEIFEYARLHKYTVVIQNFK
jgi:predicted nuclease of predicted toxin-antitoxin system